MFHAPAAAWTEKRGARLRALGVPGFFVALCLAIAALHPAAAQTGGDTRLTAGEYRVAYHDNWRTRRHARLRKRELRSDPGWYTHGNAKDPVQLIISLKDQQVTVYQGAKVLTTSRISSGKPGYSTPRGVFSILHKNRYHRSNIYSRAPMPYMQRLTWSGIALHASGSVPNRPASHGCVRLPPPFAKELFYFTHKGAHVVIAKNETEPFEISHEALFQPPGRAPQYFDFMETPRPEPPLRILVTRRVGRELIKDVQRLLNELQFNAGDVDGYMGPDTASAIRRFQQTYRIEPADGVISHELLVELYRVARRGKPQNGHIYVRQNMKPVFDAPVTIADPEKPLGAHLFTAQHFEPGDDSVRWLAVTLEDEPKKLVRQARADNTGTATDSGDGSVPPPRPSTAADALDRIDIPEEVRARISKILTPGSSLAISDEGISRETTPKGTDFIVLVD